MAAQNIRVIRATDFIESTLNGELDLEGSREALRRLATANAGRHLDLLVDLRRVRAERLTFADVYRLVGVMEEHPDAFSGKLALLDDYNEQFEKTQFFEASAEHKGFQVRTFVEYEAAIRWLHGQAEPLGTAAPSNAKPV